jgi:hypothetical protein
MQLTLEVQTFITNASAKALATSGTAGLNVVPVSVILAVADQVILYNFFMDKTAANIAAPDTPVSLAVWEGLQGVQLRATATMHTSGELFTAQQADMQEQFPDRTLTSIITLQPTELFDVSVGEPKVLLK